MLARPQSYEEIIRKLNEYMDGSEHPDLVGYRVQTRVRELVDPARFFWSLRHLAELGGYESKRVLDVGCGFGWHAVALSLLCPSIEIVGVDILPSAIQGMTECLASLKRKGTNIRVSGIVGDICNLDLPPESFDAIYSLEAIEHVHDIRKMMQKCAELLKPGGSIALVNDQNALNSKLKEATFEMWEQREYSQEWCDYLRSLRPVEHMNAKPFAQVREELIGAANPSLSPAKTKILVEGTAGLLKDEIEDLARQYRDGMSIPVVHDYDRCRDPLTGEYAERLFDPYALVKIAEEAGFVATVRHMFRKRPLSWLNGVQFKPLNKALFQLRPIFIIFGKKA